MAVTATRFGSPRTRERGFSFIEILIVMGIISVLVGGAIVAISLWAEKGPEFDTKNTMNKLSMLIENWHSQFEMYPPGDVAQIADVVGHGDKAQRPGNQTNDGIEAVFHALYWPGFKGDPAWTDTQLGNTDEDELRKPIGKRNTKALMEIVDGYGNPFVYFNRNDYGKYGDGGAHYMSQDRDRNLVDVEPLPYRNEDGTFRNPDSFQVWSMGADGEPNTDDDITPWGD